VRRKAGSDPGAISPSLKLVRHLVASHPSYSRRMEFHEILHSEYARELEGISYTPNDRGDEILASLYRMYASAELPSLRYMSTRGGDLSKESDFVDFLHSTSAANLEVLHFGGREQVLWFAPLEDAPALPRLRALSARVESWQRGHARSLLKRGRMMSMERLSIHDAGVRRHDASLARAIGSNPTLRDLRALDLTAHARFEDPSALVDALIGAPYLEHLEVLCVSIHDDAELERLRRAPKFRDTRVDRSTRCAPNPYRWR